MKAKAKRKLVAHKSEEFLNYEAGQEFHINDAELLQSLAGEVDILDHYPPITQCKVVKDHGNCKAGDVISLYADQVTTAVLSGRVVPTDDKLWRPGRPLPQSSRSFLRRIVDAAL